MGNGWDVAQEKAEQGGGHAFLRLANHGEKAVVAFRDEPKTRDVVWTGEKYERFDPAKHDVKKRVTRYLINVYVPAERAMKVFENSRPWFIDLLKLKAKYGLENKLFEIERRGNKGDTKTKYGMLPEADISDALKEEIAAAGLHDLAALAEGGGDNDEDEHDAAEPDTVDEGVAQDILSRLKRLPRPDVDVFLERFDIAKVRDLRARDVKPALAWIAKRAASVDHLA